MWGFGVADFNKIYILIAVMLGSAFAWGANSEVSGYKDWKASKVDEAQIALQRLKVDRALETLAQNVRKAATDRSASKLVAPASALQTPEDSKWDHRIEQAKLNVDIAQELTVNDYFILYLKPLRSKEAFLSAARKLSPEEMGELMIAYQKQLSNDSVDSGTLSPITIPIGFKAPPPKSLQ